MFERERTLCTVLHMHAEACSQTTQWLTTLVEALTSVKKNCATFAYLVICLCKATLFALSISVHLGCCSSVQWAIGHLMRNVGFCPTTGAWVAVDRCGAVHDRQWLQPLSAEHHTNKAWGCQNMWKFYSSWHHVESVCCNKAMWKLQWSYKEKATCSTTYALCVQSTQHWQLWTILLCLEYRASQVLM